MPPPHTQTQRNARTLQLCCSVTPPNLIDAPVDLQRLGQDVRLLAGLVAEVIADASQLHALGPDGVYGVVVALDKLVAVGGVEVGLLHRGLVRGTHGDMVTRR